MSDWLLLRLPHAGAELATWLVVDARGTPLSPPQSGPLALAAARAPGRRVCVLVDGADVLLAEPEVPVKAGAKLQQLVPYALEELLAEDIEDLHFALGKRSADSSRVPVAVVARALLDAWLATLRGAGIEPDAIYADSELLPENPGQAVALLEADAVSVRPPGGTPVTLPADALAEALEIARAGAESSATGGRGLILYTGAPEWQQHSAQVEAARPYFDGIRVQLLAGGPLALFAQQLPSTAAINLLQGEYAPVSSRGVGLKAWRVAAILLACLIALHVVGKATELQLLKRHEHQLDSSIRETFRGSMHTEASATDARRLMEKRLAGARGAGGGLLPALQALVQARDAAPGTSVQSLNFHGGALEMKLSAPDATSLDRLSQSLRNNGWQADLTGGTNSGSAYEGRIQMHSSGS
ncbi:MAG TPA: type II secretion system protein GspL [Steroidobacteraceae bacterium]|jgi:general secretion pathway protein L|nr:type II secretion system protein GspL [Steroidobacteraceae bacterium]